MNYLYFINSSYDGFTPKRIEERLRRGRLLVYNWREYFDNVEPGDVVFTYFSGSGFERGIYLVSQVSKICPDRKVHGKVIHYDEDRPLFSEAQLARLRRKITRRRRGTV